MSLKIASQLATPRVPISSAMPVLPGRALFLIDEFRSDRDPAMAFVCKSWRNQQQNHLEKVKAEKAARNFLSDSLFEKAKPYIDNPSSLEDLPRASGGKTKVYLPKELPIVLKQSGSPANRKRFAQMKQAREICERNSYQSLDVPRGRVYSNFIIESRLPITMHGPKEQIGLYIENHEKFTNAVKEFTGFLCQSSFQDITGGTVHPYATLCETPLGRYDNIALYLEKDRGKIGLVDLEKFSPDCSRWQKDWCFFTCRDAIHLFPHHLEDIMSVAKKFDLNIEIYRKDLECERDKVLKFFKLFYDDHLDFVRKKEIALQKPMAFEKLGISRTEQLKKIIEKELRREHEDIWFEGFLGKEPDKTLAVFNEKVFPQIVEATYTLINDSLEANIASHKNNGATSSNAQLLSLRTILFDYQNEAYCHFVFSTSKSIDMFGLKSFYLTKFLDLLLDTIFIELHTGKEVCYYNPRVGYAGYQFKCIFW